MLHNNAPVGKEDAIRDFPGETHLVRDENAGHAILGEVPERLPQKELSDFSQL